ncbi:MAG: outer membrane protein assembly factor BamD [Proteobacteria bacterium]|nr:outer membrane protein assembly factor BamD [Pseudomonadota bacterium]
MNVGSVRPRGAGWPAFPLRFLPLLLGLALLVVGCRTPAPSFEDVPPAEDLYAEGQQVLEGRLWFGVLRLVDTDRAIDTFQTIIDNYPYSDTAVKAELAIADAYFDDGRYDEALSYYRDFSELHPQHEKVPYAILRSAKCYIEQVASIERDQTATREALIHLDRLLAEHPYAEEAREGEEQLRALRTRLARYEMRIGDFYHERDEYQAAADRFRAVLDTYPGLGLDAVALFKLGVCLSHMKRRDEAKRIFQVVLDNYRDTEVAERALEEIAAAD